jgi:hypothetical protein
MNPTTDARTRFGGEPVSALFTDLHERPMVRAYLEPGERALENMRQAGAFIE